MVTSGMVQWCNTCGCCAESRTNARMKQECNGPPPPSHGSGGMKQQLLKLRAGLHPVTGQRLPEAKKIDGSEAWGGSGSYLRLKPVTSHDAAFKLYDPEVFEPAKSSGGLPAATKRDLMLGRIRCKQAQEARQVRKLRGADADRELVALIDNFINGDDSPQGDEAGIHLDQGGVDEQDGGSDEEFWNNLQAGHCSRTAHIQSIPTSPLFRFMGRPSSSRLSRAARVHSEASS